MESESLTIGEVARRAGIRTSAIRYYESVGILPAASRVNGIRHYDTGIFGWLTIIQMAQQAGLTVSEIWTLFNGFSAETPVSDRWQELARRKLVEVESLIRHAQAMKRILEEELMLCRCLTFEECVRCIHDENEGETTIPIISSKKADKREGQ
ncbi:MAG TPA: MerR family transcriptional regulator [Ktedonobacteraceae bacterium]|nr:MerR family transcriptional regulator [Ktedonobacteraceae bacterium]